MAYTLKRLAPILKGWTQYYRLSGSLRVFEELDGWVPSPSEVEPGWQGRVILVDSAAES